MAEQRPPLHRAARVGDTALVRTLLRQPPCVSVGADTVDAGGNTALHAAARGGHVAAIAALVEAGASVDRVSLNAEMPYTPLVIAAKWGHLEASAFLLEAGAAANQTPAPIVLAAYNGHAGVVTALIAAGADAERTDAEGHSPLYCACAKGHVDVVRVLVRALVGNAQVGNAHVGGAGGGVGGGAAALNRASPRGETPLLVACHYGHDACLAVLLRAGARARDEVRRGESWEGGEGGEGGGGGEARERGQRKEVVHVGTDVELCGTMRLMWGLWGLTRHTTVHDRSCGHHILPPLPFVFSR
jgi:ankyrin repeat protein